MKRLAVLALIFILFLTACQGEAEEEPAEDESTKESEIVEEVAAEVNEEDDIEDAEKVEQSAEVSLGGKVTLTDDAMIVEGESNLPEGTNVQVTRYRSPFTLRHLICVACGSENAKVESDGSFHFEFPPPGESFDQSYIELAIEVKMSMQPEETILLYGEKGEKMEGPFIYPYDQSGETKYKAYAPIYILVGGEETEYLIEAPEYTDPPTDYGEKEVWVDTDVTNDHRYLYVEGKSNLLEGTNVRAVYYSSEKAALPQHWFSSEDNVKRDGTFLLRIPYDSITDVGFIEFSTWGNYSHQDPDETFNVYGEDFAYMEGEQVIENEEGVKGIELKLYPNFPEFDYNLPEDSQITVDGEETKIQLPDHILFDFGESELREEAEAALDDFLGSLEKVEEGTVIQINGHTDNSGSEELNQKLSEERAEAVEVYIQENGGLDHLTFETNGYGLTRPIASNEDEDGRQKNRRVEFVINPNE
ncbi:OmpA family protein [Oceanobacillus luteolus]|uniref:OmpA family protein n=1 Tax=Oceanobacillus luteolus TaxID=1274358 RepID=A0ABW4HV90_9BACI|nr:OmpA family protein [Oceanobacillus luteolus]